MDWEGFLVSSLQNCTSSSSIPAEFLPFTLPLVSTCQLEKIRATEHIYCGDFLKDANYSSSLHTPYHKKKQTPFSLAFIT